jgi:rRNA maturation protein Nop10
MKQTKCPHCGGPAIEETLVHRLPPDFEPVEKVFIKCRSLLYTRMRQGRSKCSPVLVEKKQLPSSGP